MNSGSNGQNASGEQTLDQEKSKILMSSVNINLSKGTHKSNHCQTKILRNLKQSKIENKVVFEEQEKFEIKSGSPIFALSLSILLNLIISVKKMIIYPCHCSCLVSYS